MKAVICFALLASTCQAVELQSVWRGTGSDGRYPLVFTGDLLIATVGNHPLVGTKEFGFLAVGGEIDIERGDGLQLGRYSIDGDMLTLTLADVNKERPPSVDDKPRWKFRKYVFEKR